MLPTTSVLLPIFTGRSFGSSYTSFTHKRTINRSYFLHHRTQCRMIHYTCLYPNFGDCQIYTYLYWCRKIFLTSIFPWVLSHGFSLGIGWGHLLLRASRCLLGSPGAGPGAALRGEAGDLGLERCGSHARRRRCGAGENWLGLLKQQFWCPRTGLFDVWKCIEHVVINWGE